MQTPHVQIHIYIEVDDLERAIAFYTNGMGLHVVRRLAAGWVELGGAALPVFLLSKAPEKAGRRWTPIHLDFLTSDLEASTARAVSAGATVDRNIQIRRWGRMVNMADPFGNGIDLIELGPAGYDDMKFVEEAP